MIQVDADAVTPVGGALIACFRGETSAQANIRRNPSCQSGIGTTEYENGCASVGVLDHSECHQNAAVHSSEDVTQGDAHAVEHASYSGNTKGPLGLGNPWGPTAGYGSDGDRIRCSYPGPLHAIIVMGWGRCQFATRLQTVLAHKTPVPRGEDWFASNICDCYLWCLMQPQKTIHTL